MGSTRFPGKTLKEIRGKPILEYVISRASLAKKINTVVVATTAEKEDDAIEEFCKKIGVHCFRGSTLDVLDRFYKCSMEYPDNDVIVRVTADCPLIDPKVIDKVISKFEEGEVDYASNVLKETYPDGMDVEVFTRKALEESAREAKLKSEREHVTLYIRNNPKYKKVNVEDDPDFSKFRLTVDDSRDFEVVSFLIEKYGGELGYKDYCKDLLEHPEILSKNANIERNEGLKKSLNRDKKI